MFASLAAVSLLSAGTLLVPGTGSSSEGGAARPDDPAVIKVGAASRSVLATVTVLTGNADTTEVNPDFAGRWRGNP